MLYSVFMLALRSVRRNLLRSFLTILGIVIGVAAVVTMVTLGNGATLAIEEKITSLGTNLLMVSPGQRIGGGGGGGGVPQFTEADADAVAAQIGGVAAVAPQSRASATVVANGRNWATSISGSTNEWFKTGNWELASGRIFAPDEQLSGAAVCVIGETVRRELFSGTAGTTGLGQQLRIRQFSCEVVGILAPKGQGGMGDQDDTVLVPLHTLQRRVTGSRRVNFLMVSMAEGADSAPLKASLRQLMRERRKLADSEDDNFNIFDTQQLADTLSSTMGVLTDLLGAVAAVSLLVGGIGIMNIMLVSVTERTREIGLRLAVGALEAEVLLQFLIEAVVLSALGGLVGVALATAASYGGSLLMNVPYVFDPTINAVALVFSAVIGMLFGYFPARRAAQMDPIEALRHKQFRHAGCACEQKTRGTPPKLARMNTPATPFPGPAVRGTAAAPSAATAPVPATVATAPLGLGLLIALVVGSIIGSGIFGLPQNMAAGAGAGAIVIGWAITGFGMLMLAFTYQMLAVRKPALDNGVYAYARALSGEYVGFNAAWGYWVSAWVGNVGYLVAAFGALGYFYPAFGEGNTPAAVLGASVVLWVVHALVLRGIRAAAVVNAVVTGAKMVPLVLFIVLVAMAFQATTFKLDFWGAPALGSVLDQVRSTMLVTVWVFIGIEGASVYSARAANRADVGRATVIGFLICLALLMGVSVLSLGNATQPELAAMKNPSMAPVLERVVGTWGAVVVYLGLIVSVGGGFLAWMLLAAESLFTPAGGGVMPAWMGQTNSKGVPAHALWLTNGMVQLFLLLTLWSKASYLALISLSTAMILIPYLFSACYGLKLAWTGEGQGAPATASGRALAASSRGAIAFTGAAAVYCLWLLYAAGLKYLLLSALLYAPGAAVYMLAKRQRSQRPFEGPEWAYLMGLLVLAVVSGLMLARGALVL